VPRRVERPPSDEGSIDHPGNPLPLEKNVEGGHKSDGSQKHKEGNLHGFSLEAGQVVQPVNGRAKDRQSDENSRVKVVDGGQTCCTSVPEMCNLQAPSREECQAAITILEA